MASDDALSERVRRFLSKRNDLELRFSRSIEHGADVNIAPASMLDSITEDYRIRLPVLAYGSPIFLRKAFLSGCADFCKDPWTMEELEARLDRLIEAIETVYAFPWGTLGFEGRDALVSGKRLGLTYHETRILRFLASHRGKVVPRQALFYSIKGRPGSGASRAIDVHVSSLRKKIERVIKDREPGSVISSVRNIGYIME